MPNCQYCGSQLGANDMFCPYCGKPVAQSSPASNPLGGSSYPPMSPPQGFTGGPGSLLSMNEFIMNKKIMSLREHYDFNDRSGMKVGEGNGNFFQLPAKFQVVDNSNQEVMSVHGKLIALRKTFSFHDAQGNEIGTIKKKLFKLIGEEYWVEHQGQEFMRVYGNFTEHDYRMEVNKQPVAQVHKKWISVRDSMGVSIMGNVDHRLVIGAVIAVEHVEVTERRNR